MFRRPIVSINPQHATRGRPADAPNRLAHALRQLNDGALAVLVFAVALFFLRVGFDSQPGVASDQIVASADRS